MIVAELIDDSMSDITYGTLSVANGTTWNLQRFHPLSDLGFSCSKCMKAPGCYRKPGAEVSCLYFAVKFACQRWVKQGQPPPPRHLCAIGAVM